jgi:hypothetical protein
MPSVEEAHLMSSAPTADERLSLIRLKIERAKKHILDLNSEVVAFFATNPYEVGTKRDPETRKLIYYVSRVTAVPTAVSIIAGDVFQNLRSALDHLAQHLWLVGTGNANASWEPIFVIERDAAKYQSALPRRVKGMRQSAINVLKSIEPYKGGKGHDLFVLHTLNNIDKHRLLVAVGSSYRSFDVGAHMAGLMQRSFPGRFQAMESMNLFIRPADALCPLKVGDKLLIDSADAEVNEKMNFRFDVAFNEPEIGESKPVLEAVQQLTDLVSGIVTRFRPYLLNLQEAAEMLGPFAARHD